MDMQVEDPGDTLSSDGIKQNDKILYSPTIGRDDDLGMKKRSKSGDRRGVLFARQDDDGILVAQRTRVSGILAMVSLSRGNKRMESVNRDFMPP